MDSPQEYGTAYEPGLHSSPPPFDDGSAHALRPLAGPAATVLACALSSVLHATIAPALGVAVLPVLAVAMSACYAGRVPALISAGVATLYWAVTGAGAAAGQSTAGALLVNTALAFLVAFVTDALRRRATSAQAEEDPDMRAEIESLRGVKQQLQHRYKELEDFVENATLGLHWVDGDGKILWANRAELEMLGYTREEYIGAKIADFHADADVIADILTRLGNNEELHSYEARLRCKDGSIRHVLISSNVYREAGRFVHTRCFTRDITPRKLRELNLEEARKQQRAVLSSIQSAIYTTDSQGRITYFNDAAVKLWGRTPELGKDRWCGSWRIYRPDGSEMQLDECPMAQTLTEGRPVHGQEIIIERPDGSKVLVTPYPQPLLDDDGKLTGAVNLLVDVGDRREAERIIFRQLEISRTLLTASSLGEVSDRLLGQLCELAEAATCSIWLKQADGNLGCRHFYSIDSTRFEEFRRCTVSMAMSPGVGVPGRVLASGEPLWVPVVADDPNLPRAPWARTAGLVSAYALPIFSQHEVIGVIEFFYDRAYELSPAHVAAATDMAAKLGVVLARDSTLHDLATSEQRFRAVIAQAGVGLAQMDVDGRVLQVNDKYCEILGYSEQELLGRTLREFTYPDDMGAFVYELGLLWGGEIDTLSIEKRYVRKNGEVVWVNKNLSVVRGEAGQARYMVAIAEDITERVKAQEQAYQYQAYLQAILDNAPINVAVMDLEGRFLRYIDRSFTVPGHEQEPRIGRRLEEIYPELTDYHEAFRRARGGETVSRQLAIGAKRIQLIVLPLSGKSGAVEGVISLATDISDLFAAQEQAHQLQRYLNTAIANSAMVLAAVDNAGVYQLYVGSVLERFGINAETRVGRNFREVNAERSEAYERVLRGESLTYEEELEDKVFNIYMTPHLDSSGQIIGAIALATDITDRKRSELELRRSELRLRSTLRNAPLILVEISRDGTVELAVGRGMAEAGAEEGASVGTNVYETNKEKPDRLAMIERAMGGEEFYTTLVEGELAFHTHFAPKIGPDGEVEGVISILTNISDLYRAERALHESESKYRNLVETSQDVIFSLDAEGRWSFLNQAVRQVYGYEPEEMLGHYFWEYLPENLREREKKEFARATPGLSWFQYESQHVRKDGRIVDLQFASKVLSDEHGNIQSVSGTASDITDRKKAQHEVQERDELLRSVVDNAPIILAKVRRDGTYEQFLGNTLSSVQINAETRVGANIRDIYEVGNPLRDTFEAAIAGKQSQGTVEFKSIGRTFHLLGLCGYGDGDQPSHAILLGVDITQRAGADQAWRDRESRVDPVPDGAGEKE